MQEKNNIN